MNQKCKQSYMKGVRFLTVLFWLSIGGLLWTANHVDLALLLFYILYCMWLFNRYKEESLRFSKAGSYIVEMAAIPFLALYMYIIPTIFFMFEVYLNQTIYLISWGVCILLWIQLRRYNRKKEQQNLFDNLARVGASSIEQAKELPDWPFSKGIQLLTNKTPHGNKSIAYVLMKRRAYWFIESFHHIKRRSYKGGGVETQSQRTIYVGCVLKMDGPMVEQYAFCNGLSDGPSITGDYSGIDKDEFCEGQIRASTTKDRELANKLDQLLPKKLVYGVYGERKKHYVFISFGYALLTSTNEEYKQTWQDIDELVKAVRKILNENKEPKKTNKASSKKKKLDKVSNPWEMKIDGNKIFIFKHGELYMGYSYKSYFKQGPSLPMPYEQKVQAVEMIIAKCGEHIDLSKQHTILRESPEFIVQNTASISYDEQSYTGTFSATVSVRVFENEVSLSITPENEHFNWYAQSEHQTLETIYRTFKKNKIIKNLSRENKSKLLAHLKSLI